MMAFCTYCGQQFNRNEHLERHLTTHTNIKRFKCHICHVSFSRADVLQKHIAVHGDVGGVTQVGVNQLGAARTRPRTQTACRNCARMKAKCDANTPCSRCEARQLTCHRRRKKKLAAPNGEDDVQALHQAPIIPGGNGDESNDTESVGDNEDQGMALVDCEEVTLPSALLRRQSQALSVENIPLDYRRTSSSHQGGSNNGAATIDPAPANHLEMYMDVAPEEQFDNLPGILPTPMTGWIYPAKNDGEAHSQGSRDDGILSGPPLAQGDGDNIVNNPQNLLGDTSAINLEQSGDGKDQWDFNYQDVSPSATVEAPEHPALLAAQEFWSSFRCNPSNDVAKCPRTAGVLLESLSHIPESDELWGWLRLNFPSPGQSGDIISIQLRDAIRDRLSAISQAFLQRALEVHKLDPAMNSSSSPSPHEDISPGFLILPPSATLEHFLREYMRCLEPFYNLIPGGILDANALMSRPNNNRATTLLILLMIAQGATSDPTNEARRLGLGVTEVCRISLFDMIEKDVGTCHHHLLMHSSLLFAIQAAWSGDKWLMDIGMGQRNIYISIIRHGGMFNARSDSAEILQTSEEWDIKRAAWLEQEKNTRLTYAWVLLDLELSLFHDANTLIQTVELNNPLPCDESLWLAPDTLSWQQILTSQRLAAASLLSRPSLRTLFQWFLNDSLEAQQHIYINSFTLRLLLHPLHTLIQNSRQLLSYFGDDSTGSQFFSPVTKRSTLVRIEELQFLLHRWRNLYEAHAQKLRLMIPFGDETQINMHPSMTSALITYHIIYLNTVVSFPEIEALARQQLPDSQLRGTSMVSGYIENLGEALIHAGQIICQLRTLERKARPAWWPAALYRATMVLWACSVFYGPSWSNAQTLSRVIDAEQPYDGEGRSTGNYQTNFVPALRGYQGNTSPTLLDDSVATVNVCLLAFRQGVATRFSEGVRRKLNQFRDIRCGLAEAN